MSLHLEYLRDYLEKVLIVKINTTKELLDYTKLFVEGSGTDKDPYHLSAFGTLALVLGCISLSFRKLSIGVKHENKNN